MAGLDWDDEPMGYVRVSTGAMFQEIGTPITSHDQCPHQMIGLSYFWKETEQTSCTIRSVSPPGDSSPDVRSLQQHCRVGAEETFIGCIYETKGDCLAAMRDPEYTEIAGMF